MTPERLVKSFGIVDPEVMERVVSLNSDRLRSVGEHALFALIDELERPLMGERPEIIPGIREVYARCSRASHIRLALAKFIGDHELILSAETEHEVQKASWAAGLEVNPLPVRSVRSGSQTPQTPRERKRFTPELGSVEVGSAGALHDLLGSQDETKSSLQTQRDLSTTQRILGNGLREVGDTVGARERYEAGLEAAQLVADSHPDSFEAQLELSVSHNKLGDLLREVGDFGAARRHYDRGLELAERLAIVDPGMTVAVRDLSISDFRADSLEHGDSVVTAAAQSVSESELGRLLRAGAGLLGQAHEALQSCGLFPPPLSTHLHVKSEDAVIETIERRRVLKRSYGLGDVTDIVGMRLVTLLHRDIGAIVNNLFRVLRGDVPNVRVFERARLLEFAHHVSATHAGEWVKELSDELEAIYKNHYGPDPSVKFSKDLRAQFSSVHVVIGVKTVIDGRQIDVPLEIQVRSVFEEAWSDIDRKLFYKADKHGQLTGERQRLAAARHLGVLKSLLDAAAAHAEILGETNFGVSSDRPPDVHENLDGVEYIKEVCKPLTRHRELLDEFAALAADKYRLDDEIKQDASRASSYVLLADQFARLFTRIAAAETTEDTENYRTVVHLLAMEEALCRLLSGNLSQMTRALELYRTLVAQYPEYPACSFRLAQACAQLLEKVEEDEKRREYTEEAAENYKRARAQLAKTPANAGFLISPGQRVYLDENIERLQSFVLWRLSDLRRLKSREGGNLADVEAVLAAYHVAEHGLRGRFTPGQFVSNFGVRELMNSAAYFALDAANMTRQLGVSPPGLPSDERIRELLDGIEAASNSDKTGTIQIWDTLLHGFGYLHDPERELRAAKRVCEIHALADLGSAGDYDREVHQRAFAAAWRVLSKASVR